MKTQKTFLGIPYNWDKPTWRAIKERTWNKKDHRLFPPRVFGWGYTTNFYELFNRRKKLLTGLVILTILVCLFIGNTIQELQKAHSTFEKYYSFRGCTQLLKRADTYGICKTDKGQTIKISGKWYLDGDLPKCFFLCFDIDCHCNNRK